MYIYNMIKVGDVLISDQVVDEHFVCDLIRCKGACCVDGDAGAPLENNELEQLNDAYKFVLPYLTKESVRELEEQGKYIYNTEFGWVTPTVSSGTCAYGITDARGIVKCGIEQAYMDGKITWRKPISCHLFPIRIKKSKKGKTEMVNYEPRQDLCKAACSLGKKLKVPAYIFLQDALIRKYGDDFYKALCATAEQHVAENS
jgi:hypothetical protein